MNSLLGTHKWNVRSYVFTLSIHIYPNKAALTPRRRHRPRHPKYCLPLDLGFDGPDLLNRILLCLASTCSVLLLFTSLWFGVASSESASFRFLTDLDPLKQIYIRPSASSSSHAFPRTGSLPDPDASPSPSSATPPAPRRRSSRPRLPFPAHLFILPPLPHSSIHPSSLDLDAVSLKAAGRGCPRRCAS